MASARASRSMGLGGPWQNLAMVRSLEAINGYNPLRIGIYDRLVAPGESNWRMELRDFPASFDGYDCALARTLGLEFVVLGRPIEEVPHLARRPVADVLRAGPDVWVYRLKDPAPRLNFTRRVQVADADAVSGPGWLAASPAPDRVLIDDDTPPAASYAGAVSAGSARIASWRPARIEIEVDSELGGVLALHETWYPGWIAEIDGKRVPILRADVLFRGRRSAGRPPSRGLPLRAVLARQSERRAAAYAARPFIALRQFCVGPVLRGRARRALRPLPDSDRPPNVEDDGAEGADDKSAADERQHHCGIGAQKVSFSTRCAITVTLQCVI